MHLPEMDILRNVSNPEKNGGNMASASTPGIAPQQIEADLETYLALKVIDNYTPHNARDALNRPGFDGGSNS